MEEIDLKELFELFWAKKVQIILVVLIFMIMGVIYTLGFTTPKYSAETTLILASQNNNQQNENAITTSTSTELTVNSKLVSTYSELIKSKNIIRQVISNLNLSKVMSEDELKNSVSVSSVKDTEIIKITVTTKTPVNSSKIANEIAKVFSEKVKEIYSIENVQVVDEAETPSEPSNINHPKDVAIFAAVGLIVASAYVLIINMLDTTVKTAEEIEREFKLPVLASIPLYNPEAQKKKGGRR